MRPGETFLQPEQQARLDTHLDAVVESVESVPTANTLRALLRGGVSTVRDVLASGQKRLVEVDRVTAYGVGQIRPVLLDYFPEMPVPKTADVALAASICPTLRDVTARVLGGRMLELPLMTKRVSVHDILTRHTGLFYGTFSAEEQRIFDALLQKAILFAADFQQAQRAHSK